MRGFTLVEVIAVLAILGIVLAIGVVAMDHGRPKSSERDEQRARTTAILTGRPVVEGDHMFLPDGRVLGPGYDALTGARRAQ